MRTVIASSRYLIIIPIIGLSLAAAAFFVIGGFQLIRLVIETLLSVVGLTEAHHSDVPISIEIVEYVHTFLIGTVLYITAVGFYQLFIAEVNFPGWLRIDSTEELETNLIGVTVVVLAVNFMGVVFTGDASLLFEYGAGIALPIAALALFIGLRTWSTNLVKSSEYEQEKSEGKKSLEN